MTRRAARTRESNSAPVHSVVAAFSVLERLATASGPMTLAALSAALSATKPRAHRHLRTLMLLGYVRQEPSGRYALTGKLAELGRTAFEPEDFISAARATLPALRDRVQQTVVASLVEAEGVRVVEMLRAGAAVEISARPGAFFDFHSSAQGKIALAFGPEALWSVARKRVPGARLKRLKAEIELVRKRGWATAPQEVLIGINALAAPVFDRAGALAGAIAVLGSIQFVKPTPDLVAAVRAAAQEASARLGFNSAPGEKAG